MRPGGRLVRTALGAAAACLLGATLAAAAPAAEPSPTLFVGYGDDPSGHPADFGFPGWSPHSLVRPGERAFFFGTPPGSNPLVAGTLPGAVHAHDTRGLWRFTAPGSAYVYELDLFDFFHSPGSGGALAVYGLFNAGDDLRGPSSIEGSAYLDGRRPPVGANPAVEQDDTPLGERRVCAFDGTIPSGAPCPDPGAGGTHAVRPGNVAVIEHVVGAPTGRGSAGGLTGVGGIFLAFGDQGRPPAPRVLRSRAWTARPRVSVVGREDGVGVGRVVVDGSRDHISEHVSCAGAAYARANHYAPCWQRAAVHVPLPRQPDGVRSVRVRVISATGHAGPATTTEVRVDRTAPRIALGGSLVAHRTLPAGVRLRLVVTAADGAPAPRRAQRSGVVGITVRLDGRRLAGGTRARTCRRPTSSCRLGVAVTVGAARLHAGTHRLVVTATDAAGNARRAVRSVSVAGR